MQFSFKVLALSIACALYITGCSDEPATDTASAQSTAPEEQDEQASLGLVQIRGSLVYQARGALEPSSHAQVEVSRPPAQENAQPEVLASERIDLIGRESPVAFELEIESATFARHDDLQLLVRIVESNRPAWTTDPVALTDAGDGEVDVGELVLLPLRSAAFASILHCGRLQVSAGYHNDDLVLKAAGKDYLLLPTESDSGARFEAEGDPSTRFWSRGDTALLTLNGVSYPECVPPGALPKPFVAIGHEPSWEMRLERGQMSLRRGEEVVLQGADYTVVEDSNEGRSLQAGEEDRVKVQARREVCYDSMSAMPYPHRVTLSVDGESLAGCGGDPRRLLQGAQWRVHTINGNETVNGSRIDLSFHQNDRVSGFASCNNLSAEFQLDGEHLTISAPMTTKKACASAVMQQEQRLVGVLQRVKRFRFTDEGELELHTNEMEVITARME